MASSSSSKLLAIQVLFYISILLVNCSAAGRGKDEPELLTEAILLHLNANPNKVYDYKKASLVYVERKVDVLETTSEVEVTCNNVFPEIPCNDGILVCHAFVGSNSLQTDYTVFGDVQCNPKIDITIEDVEADRPGPQQIQLFPNQKAGTGKLDLSHEAIPPEQENPDFVAVRRENIPCLGCPFDLNKDVEGVNELINAAVKHIETERTQRYKITNVRRLQQQIVAGVKYILLAEVAGTTCSKDADLSAPCVLDTAADPFICEVVFIEQPWISKSKHIIKNNCTVSQEFSPIKDRNDMSNEIIPHKDLDFSNPKSGHFRPNYDEMAMTGNLEQPLDASRLSDLESQIIPDYALEPPRETQPSEHSALRFIQQDFNEPPVISTNVDNLKVEPLKSNSQHAHLRTLFVSMPMVDEAEPIVMTYIPPNRYGSFFNGQEGQSSMETLRDPYVEDDIFVRYVRDSSDSSSEEKSKNKSKSDSSSSEENKVREAKNKKDSSSEESKSSSEEKKHRITTSNPNLGNAEDVNDIVVVKREAGHRSSESSESHGKSKNKSKKDSSSDSKDSSEEDRRRRNKRAAYLRNKLDGKRWKRSVGQLEKVPPEEKIIVRDLADFAANTLDNIDDDNHKRVILQILGAKKLKLEGIYYQIILRLGISHCHEHEHHESCREKLFTNLTKICKVQVHVDDDYSNPKVVKSQCQNIKKDENDRNRTNYSRYRRQVLGGESTMDVNHPSVQKFLRSTLIRLDSASDHPNKHKTVEVISASSQVVAGARYVIKAKIGLSKCKKSDSTEADTCDLLEGSEPELCTIEVWDRPWLKKTLYTIHCGDKKYEVVDEPTSRSKRSLSSCAGCPVATPTSDALPYLENALLHLDTTSSADNKYIPIKVLESSSQVVAGVLKKIKAEIALSNCSKANSSETDGCTQLEGSPSSVCTFSIWEQPWLNFTQTEVECEGDEKKTFRSKRSLRNGGKRARQEIRWGEWAEIGPEATPTSDALPYLENALLHLDTTLFADNKYIPIKVLESSSHQVVGGVHTKIKAEIALSNCSKANSSETDGCTQLEGSPSRVCTFFICEHPVLNYNETVVDCEGDEKNTFRLKWTLRWGKWAEDADAHERRIKNQAERALELLSRKAGPNRKFRLISITDIFGRGEPRLGLYRRGSYRQWYGSLSATINVCTRNSEIDIFKCNHYVTCNITITKYDRINPKFIKCENDDEEYAVKDFAIFKTNREKKEAFKFFVFLFDKKYKSKDEFNYRLKVFKNNLKKIERLNEMDTAIYDITEFADLTEQEFSKSHGYRPDLPIENELPFIEAATPHLDDVPKEFDWRTKNAVTKVKNQGLCGSCWAFSVTGNVEGQYAIKHGKLLEFSEQELVDCDKVDEGCDGGLMDNAYRVIEKLGGLETESDYPYEGADDKCTFNVSKVQVQLTGAQNISHNETNMAKWLVTNGPISIAINANAMQFYVGGVSHPFKALCNPNNLDHGVLIVGYGVHTYKLFNKTMPYWIVKNSWGTSWGEQGYYRVYRGDGTCGLNQTPSSAIVA